ncbi:MAG: translation elongation factor Ts [Candidatus Pacebacteria bacterium]|nr:translation elongation factor Ts [Candidatus Paceibacterota bacterium]
MSDITTETIKQLRTETGVSVMQCKKALEEAGGDLEKAKVILRKQSANSASKKADRELGAGIVRAYIHNNNSVGVLVELNCETDFVAQNKEFVELADNIAMHIAAMNPAFTRASEVTDEAKAKVIEVMQAEVAGLDKPEDMKAQILEGKVSGYFKEKALLDQAYIKNPDITVEKLIEEAIQKIGEKIEIARFSRFGVLES